MSDDATPGPETVSPRGAQTLGRKLLPCRRAGIAIDAVLLLPGKPTERPRPACKSRSSSAAVISSAARSSHQTGSCIQEATAHYMGMLAT